jgi:glycosyltransferase involved in cell wall biosynthesis
VSEPAQTLPITLCMLTRNEEDRLPASLGAVRERVARMVVVDAESEDRTAEVARRLGADVFVRPWEGFVAARRHLLSLSATPWTLMIDADEVAGAELWDELETLGFPDCEVAGFQLRRRTVYQGRTLRRSFQPDWKTALFCTERGYFEDRAVHEAVLVRGPLTRLRAEIRHHSYRSAAEHYRRIREYAELGARDLAASGKRAGPANLWLRPAWRWFAELFLLGGIVDGRLGLTMAARSAYSIHLRYRYLQRLLRDAAR